MLATSAVTFWRWLTGQPLPLDAATTAEDRRVWLRHTAKLNIRCEQADEDGESGVYAVVCDISRGGIQIVAPRRFEPGSILNIELTPAQGDSPLAVLACVIRAQPHGESDWAMGCRFSSELEDEQLHAFGAARVRPSTPDPRGWSRFSCEAKAFYQRINSDDPAHHSARVLNISVSGVALQRRRQARYRFLSTSRPALHGAKLLHPG